MQLQTRTPTLFNRVPQLYTVVQFSALARPMVCTSSACPDALAKRLSLLSVVFCHPSSTVSFEHCRRPVHNIHSPATPCFDPACRCPRDHSILPQFGWFAGLLIQSHPLSTMISCHVSCHVMLPSRGSLRINFSYPAPPLWRSRIDSPVDSCSRGQL